MCGIAGYLGQTLRDDTELAGTMRAAIRYRGKEADGEWGELGVARLFHSRLKIIDLAGGAQPMEDVTGQFVIVFNGEIYNYLELRLDYQKRGAVFRTHSDTEVILEGFKLRGPRALDDFVGMYAFAIWDRKSRQLFIARDRLGKKPLYWMESSGRFYFASSIDAFSGVPGWSGELSEATLDFYSAVGSFPQGMTVFKQVRSLAPGSYALVQSGQSPKITRYWHMHFGEKHHITFDHALQEYESILTDAVRVRLRADVPVALTFSGGVDSGTVAAIARRECNTSLACYTIDYHTPEDPSDEVKMAKRVAAELGLNWQFLHFNYHADLFDSIDKALDVVDQPCNHVAIGYSLRLYEFVQQHARVVLTGNGADELFLGYSGNEELLRKDLSTVRTGFGVYVDNIRGIFGKANNRASGLADYQCEYVRAHLKDHPNDVSSNEIVETLRSDIIDAEVRTHVDLYTFMALTYYTCDANFRIPDIAGMRAQVEVRSPYLDHRMVEFAASLPGEFKIGDVNTALRNKLLPRRYYERLVPTDVAWAIKKGMGSNLRYDENFAYDANFHRVVDEALQEITVAGIDSNRYRCAWGAFTRDKNQGIRYPSSAGVMVGGVMLGRWLKAWRLKKSSSAAAKSITRPAYYQTPTG